mgnify:CR=1 FL=1
MSITSIILSHYQERENNLKRIIDDLLAGTIKPEEIIVFIDNPAITFEDSRVTIIRSSKNFLPMIRFILGSMVTTDYCFFIDDDLSVKSETLENFVRYAKSIPDAILGLEGSILGTTQTPYSNDTPLKRGSKLQEVDIVIRTYWVPQHNVLVGFDMQNLYPNLPRKSLDDVYLCLGNKYLNDSLNYVIPVDEESDLVELPDGGVGQSLTEDHYKNRNEVCRKLMDIYAK